MVGTETPEASMHSLSNSPVRSVRASNLQILRMRETVCVVSMLQQLSRVQSVQVMIFQRHISSSGGPVD